MRADGEDFRIAIGCNLCDPLCHLRARQRDRVGGHAGGMFERFAHVQQQRACALAFQRQEDCELLQAERQVLGLDHALVGRTLVQHWKFPDLIQRAIGNHHAPMRDDLGDIPSVVHVANAVVHALDLDGDPDELAPPLAQDAWDSLALDADGMRRVFADTEAQFDQACRILAGGE